MLEDEGPFRAVPFDHRQHVKFAWTALCEHPVGEAEDLVADEISRFAAVHAPGKYHDTLTRFWVRLVAHTRSVDGGDDFDAHMSRFPVLADRRAPWRHYAESTLAAPAARNGFVEPDLRPMP
jgi:hypothetical protein